MSDVAQIFTNGKFQALDNDGSVVSYGYLYIEDVAGNPVDTFKDSRKSNKNTYPIRLSASGKADVYLDRGVYNITLKDAQMRTIWTITDYIIVSSKKYISDTPPDATYDINKGYDVGDAIICSTNDIVYYCKDNTPNNAIWIKSSGVNTTDFERNLNTIGFQKILKDFEIKWGYIYPKTYSDILKKTQVNLNQGQQDVLSVEGCPKCNFTFTVTIHSQAFSNSHYAQITSDTFGYQNLALENNKKIEVLGTNVFLTFSNISNLAAGNSWEIQANGVFEENVNFATQFKNKCVGVVASYQYSNDLPFDNFTKPIISATSNYSKSGFVLKHQGCYGVNWIAIGY